MFVCVALDLQHTKHMRRIILSSVGSGSTIFLHSISGKALFLKKKIKTEFALIFATTLSKIFLNIRRTERDVIINICRSFCKVPVVLATS